MAKRTRWFIGLGVLVTALVGPGIIDLARLTHQQHQLDRQLEALRLEHERLLAHRERLQTDPTYVEGLIRTTFKQARPGEYVVPIDPPASTRPSTGGIPVEWPR